MKGKGLLIDADLYLYKAAAAVEEETDWGDDLWTLHSDLKQARSVFNSTLERFQDELHPSEIVLCFSDPTRKTFRHDLFPQYKRGRGRKPLAYTFLRDECLEQFKCVVKPRLEADDVMGIISTRAPGKFIIVSDDKDMQSIPGLLYCRGGVVEISEAQADRYFLIQTLTGDATDGYPGCPGIGPVKAANIVDADKKTAFNIKYRWRPVVEAYEKAGLTPEDALLQARLARILRASDWNFENSEVHLWSPNTSR